MSKPLRLTFEAQPTTSRNAALFRQAKTAIYAVKQAQKELLDAPARAIHTTQNLKGRSSTLNNR